MIRQSFFSLFLLLTLLINESGKAQTSANAAGNTATGINGKVSCSIGQPFFNLSSSPSGKLREGIQQPVSANDTIFHITENHEAIASSGISNIGSNGKVSYTIGQPFYIIKNSPAEKLRDGIQQPVHFAMLNVHVFLQGFYLPGTGTMVEIIGPGLTDTITVELHASTSPYDELYSAKVLLDIHGRAEVYVPSVFRGSTCYFAIKHRNHLQTWSKYPFTITASNLFDLTY